jgi:PIF1-like helicase
LLVIDEISMVRADLLDAVDDVLRRYRDHSRAFGGVQLLMIGDLHQLPPVVKPEDWELLRPHYVTPYFFGSLALHTTDMVAIELQHIFRQSDRRFIRGDCRGTQTGGQYDRRTPCLFHCAPGARYLRVLNEGTGGRNSRFLQAEEHRVVS